MNFSCVFFFSVYECFLCMYVYVRCACLVPAKARWHQILQELELWTAVSLHVGAVNQIRSSARAAGTLLTMTPLQPLLGYLSYIYGLHYFPVITQLQKRQT